MKPTHIRIGVAGLGWAGSDILRSLSTIPDVEIVAAAAPREKFRTVFEQQFGGKTYDDVAGLAADRDVDAIWIATPTHLHCEHALVAARNGKHVVVEKPFATSLQQCEEMIAAADENEVVLIAGGVRSFDPAIVEMRRVIQSGRIGRLGALNSWSYTAWMVLPREPHEIDSAIGGGLIYNQAPHPVDALRLLGGGLLRTVRAVTGEWMSERACPGYFSALFEFQDGTPATISYNGYGYMFGWEFVPWGETQPRREARDALNDYRRELRSGVADERKSREAFRFGETGSELIPASDGAWTPVDAGLMVASCERGEVRQSRDGLFVYDDRGRHDEPIRGSASARVNEYTELRDAVDGKGSPLHDGAWGMATLEAVIAIMRSAVTRSEITLHHQVAAKA